MKYIIGLICTFGIALTPLIADAQGYQPYSGGTLGTNTIWVDWTPSCDAQSCNPNSVVYLIPADDTQTPGSITGTPGIDGTVGTSAGDLGYSGKMNIYGMIDITNFTNNCGIPNTITNACAIANGGFLMGSVDWDDTGGIFSNLSIIQGAGLLNGVAAAAILATGAADFSFHALELIGFVLAIIVALLVFYWGMRKIKHSTK